MRGISVKHFGGPEVLEYSKDLPAPGKPDKTQVLIQVKAAGVNPVDTYIVKGTVPFKPLLPFTPGLDGAGIVEEVGSEVTKFKKGDRVWFKLTKSGSYAEKALNEESFTYPLHESLTFQQGASLGIPYCSAYRAMVTKANLRPGQTMLIHGASGAVGVACCQLGRALGATVLGTAGTEEGLKLVLEHGASKSFNHRKPGYIDEIKAAAPQIDVIIEMLASTNLETDMKLAGSGTRIVVVGSRGEIPISPGHLMMTEVVVTGIILGKATPSEWQEMGAYICAGQSLGWVRPVVGQQFPIEQASDAHKEIIEHAGGTKGKIVLNL